MALQRGGAGFASTSTISFSFMMQPGSLDSFKLAVVKERSLADSMPAAYGTKMRMPFLIHIYSTPALATQSI